MKKIFVVTLFLTYFGVLFANDISKDQAKIIAENFVSHVVNNGAKKIFGNISLDLVYQAQVSQDKEPDFYVFNKSSNSGFIIVAGDDRANEILGYSDDGSFDYNNLSPEAKSWIDGYKDEIEYLRTNNVKTLNVRQAPTIDHTVAPLLGNIAWNQDSPYNDQCPRYDYMTRCATGCVATAMAQILYYHKWPEVGKGSHTYSPSILNGATLTADFGNTHYNWSAMLPEYDSNSSSESRSAVAQLMLHCGISVNMSYSSSSGAFCIDVPNALVNDFNYDKAAAYRVRNNYSCTEWDNVIMRELDAGRPVFVTGYSSAGGHAFVFDGYDADGLIHVNWGWGKMSNGYFRTTALTPASQGIGGSKGGFNYKQAIVTGIQKPVSGSEDDIELSSSEGLIPRSSAMINGGNVSMTLGGKISNVDWKDDHYDYGLLLLDENKDTVCVIPGATNNVLAEGKDTIGTKFQDVNFGILKDGSYKLYPVCRVTGGKNQWNRIHDNSLRFPNYLTVSVSGDKVNFILPDYFDLQVKNAQVPSKMYSTVSPNVKATIVNNGDVEYYGEIKASIVDKNTNKTVAQSEGYMVDLNPGDSTQIQFTDAYTLPAGDYYLNFVNDDMAKIDANHDVTVYPAPTGAAVLAPAEQLAFTDNNNVDRDNMSITAKITCTQGVFGGQVYLFIYSADGSTQMGCLNPEYVYVAAGDTAKVTFTGPFENGVYGTTYMAYLVKYDGASYTYFNPKDEASCKFRLMTSTGIDLNEYKDDDKNVQIYDINGRVLKYNNVNDLPHGIYIIKEKGKSVKFVK
jgi:hypothetical protein